MTKAKNITNQARNDAEFIARAPEVSLFMCCFGGVNELKALNASIKDGKISQKDFEASFNMALRQFCNVAEATVRFDIIWPVFSYGRFSPFFWRWYNWWDDYLCKLNVMQMSHVRWLASERSPEVEKFRPPGSWIDYRQNPAFTVISD